jgi:hypothetical protein
MIIGLSIVLLLVGAVGLLTRFAPDSERTTPFYASEVTFLESFSISRYRPMLRLASQMDKKFLNSAHGEVLAKCYRKIQRNLLRQYLRDASRDFNRLYAIAIAKCVKANSDPDDMSLGLLEQQMTFILQVWGIEARLLADEFLPFAFDLTPVVEQMDALARETRALARPRYSYQAI